jgi:hypothetical protein
LPQSLETHAGRISWLNITFSKQGDRFNRCEVVATTNDYLYTTDESIDMFIEFICFNELNHELKYREKFSLRKTTVIPRKITSPLNGVPTPVHVMSRLDPTSQYCYSVRIESSSPRPKVETTRNFFRSSA